VICRIPGEYSSNVGYPSVTQIKLQKPSYAAYHGRKRNPVQAIPNQSFNEKLSFLEIPRNPAGASGTKEGIVTEAEP
jgi:hypothetical protein|tara:strand:- start:200 stop:430 length:231 start_codon:yes stop_codon:yes gene_type:complete